MSKPRIIYARPGDMIEIRMVTHEAYDLNARGWRDQTYSTRMLIMTVDNNEIAFGDPMTRKVPWRSTRPTGGSNHGE